MGGRLHVCELSEVYWRGVAKHANRTKQNNNPNEKFSQTEHSQQHATRTRNSQKRENVKIRRIRQQQIKKRKTRIAQKAGKCGKNKRNQKHSSFHTYRASSDVIDVY